MGKIMNQVSCMIKTREYNVGFPGRFSHYPKNMDSERLEYIHDLVLEAMQDPVSISKSEDGVRKIIIGDGKYMVLGVSGYLSSIMPELSSEYNSFCDLSGTRKTYGFAGYVWELKAGVELPQDFPQISEFAELLKMEILPHWKDSANSVWAENVHRGVQVPYNLEVRYQEDDISRKNIENGINTNKHKVAVFGLEETALICEAMFWASKGHEISLCTDLDYYEESGTGFMNLYSHRCNQRRELYDNIRDDARELQEDELQRKKKEDDGEGIGLYIDKNWEKKEEQNHCTEERAEKISVVFKYEIVYKNKEEAKRDYSRLCRLMEEYTCKVNGEIVYYGEESDSFPERLLNGILNGSYRSRITFKADFLPRLNIEKFCCALSEQIEIEKRKGYLKTVEPLKYYEEKKFGDQEHKKTEKGGLPNKIFRRNMPQNVDMYPDRKSEGTESIDLFTQKLAGIYGDGDKESSPKSNNTGSSSENPFSL